MARRKFLAAPNPEEQEPRLYSRRCFSSLDLAIDRDSCSSSFRTLRDGFYCIWAYPIDSLTKRPAGKPQAVFHSHGARQSMRNANLSSQGVSVARDKIVFNQGEVTGNIWTTVFNPD